MHVIPVEIMTKEDLEAFQEKIQADLVIVFKGQQEILQRLDLLKNERSKPGLITSGYIPALEYMRAVGIKRWKFDQLIAENKIRTLKKKRKIYVPLGEVERYFNDPSIQ
jgi:hypothetical protein